MADLSIPDGFGPQGVSQIPDGFAPAAGYTSQYFPVSVDSGGSYHPAVPGLLQRAYSAATAPGDVFAGKTPILGADSQANPNLINRATDFAGFFGPQSTALRSGEVIPGEMASPAVPSAQQLKGAASGGYDAFRNSGLEFHGPAVANVLQTIKQNLESDGIIAEHAPKTFAALNKAVGDVAGALNQPGTDSIATAANMQSVRRSLTGVSGDNTDMAAARSAKQAIDGFLSGPPAGAVLSEPPGGAAATARTFADANANFAAAQRSNDLTGTLDRANTGILERAETRAHASNSGANIDNAIRQRVASLLEKPAEVSGFSDAEIKALQSIVDGTATQNTARWFGNKFGGGGGLGSLAAMGVGGYAGSHMGPEGAALGAMFAPALGQSAKGLENWLARRSLNSADEMVRMRSPLYDAMQAQGLLSPAMNRNGAVLRALLPGLLSPPVPQSQPMPRGLLDEWA